MNVIVNDMKDLQDLKKMIAPPDKTSSNNEPFSKNLTKHGF